MRNTPEDLSAIRLLTFAPKTLKVWSNQRPPRCLIAISRQIGSFARFFRVESVKNHPESQELVLIRQKGELQAILEVGREIHLFASHTPPKSRYLWSKELR